MLDLLVRTAAVVSVAFAVLIGALVFALSRGVPSIQLEIAQDVGENAIGIGLGYLLAVVIVELRTLRRVLDGTGR